ncbi:MAG: replication factor C small subunit [Candidatus Aenigmatarchaeota archaeon]|nr:replication factor C small subunit [Candidatus Aenigmarchaeota archaeon]
MQNIIWAEKYRPKTLDEIINQKHVVERLKAFVKEKNVPHCLFAGPPGTGKTTATLALAHDIFGEHWKSNLLELNASDERGINVIRGKVKDFARSKSIGEFPFKIVMLDEADALTAEAQHALRRTMEAHASTTRFFLICNYSSKIIDPIQSRCAVFRFKPLTAEDIKAFLDRIIKTEKIDIDDKAIDTLIYLSEGDLRKASNILQSAASMKKTVTEQSIYDVVNQAKPKEILDLINLIIKKDFKSSRKQLYNLLFMQGLAGEDIIKEMHKQIFELNVPEEKKILMTKIIGEYDFRLSEGANELIQLEALIAELMTVF